MIKIGSKPKVTLDEYTTRKLQHYTKKRVRRKKLRDMEELYFSYCFKHWGLAGLMYAVYCGRDAGELFKTIVYATNPLLNLIPKDYSWSGNYYPVPFYE